MATAKKAPARKNSAGHGAASTEQRKKLFIEAFLSNGGNITAAGVSAGFSPKTAAQQGSRLFRKVEVQAEIQRRQQKLNEKLELSTERTLREIARLAYFDPRKLLDNTGRPKPLHELDDDTAAAIAGIDVEDKLNPPDPGSKERTSSIVLKYRIADKNAALDKAMKHLGLFKEDNKQKTLLDGVDRETLIALREKLLGSA